MTKINLLSSLATAAFTLCLTVPAGATTVSLTAGPLTNVAGASTTTFNSGSLPSSFVASGPSVGVVTGSLFDVYTAPTSDSTPFVYVGPHSSVTDTFASPTSYFGLYWGSPDTYNTLSFTDMNGVTTVYGEGGSSIAGLINSNYTASYVNFVDSGAAWKSVTFTSSVAAFEFDNIASQTAATPEPASIALLAGGLLAIGAGAMRRRKNA